MDYICLFTWDKNETRKERDFRIWIHQEESIFTLDLYSEYVIKNDSIYLENNYSFWKFMLLYRLLKNDLSRKDISKTRYQKIRKVVKRKVRNEEDQFFNSIGISGNIEVPLILLNKTNARKIMTEIFYTKEFALSMETVSEMIKKESNNYQRQYIDKTLKDMKLYHLMA